MIDNVILWYCPHVFLCGFSLSIWCGRRVAQGDGAIFKSYFFEFETCMRLFHESSGRCSKYSHLSLVGWYERETIFGFVLCLRPLMSQMSFVVSAHFVS